MLLDSYKVTGASLIPADAVTFVVFLQISEQLEALRMPLTMSSKRIKRLVHSSLMELLKYKLQGAFWTFHVKTVTLFRMIIRPYDLKVRY